MCVYFDISTDPKWAWQFVMNVAMVNWNCAIKTRYTIKLLIICECMLRIQAIFVLLLCVILSNSFYMTAFWLSFALR